MGNNVTRNWKTTTFGVLSLLGVGLKMATGAMSAGAMPTVIAAFNDPATVSAIAAGVGLLVAKDGDKSGTVNTPR